MDYVCGDNRFEIIERYKNELISATNIESSPDEMAVLDNILFRFWQMGWLKEQEPKAIEYHDNPFTGLPVAHCPNCKRYARQFHASVEEETHYCPWCGQEVKWNDIN